MVIFINIIGSNVLSGSFVPTNKLIIKSCFLLQENVKKSVSRMGLSIF